MLLEVEARKGYKKFRFPKKDINVPQEQIVERRADRIGHFNEDHRKRSKQPR